jgi:RES domain-containing protein
MMYYRIVTSLARAADLSGTGAWLVGGRWNPVGTHVLYASENPALAVLEVLVHADVRDLPDKLFLVFIEVDDDSPLRTVAEADLPYDWRKPEHLELKRMGAEWLADPTLIGFHAPSSVLPVQRNLILNPGHPQFQRFVKVVDVREIRPDARILS